MTDDELFALEPRIEDECPYCHAGISARGGEVGPRIHEVNLGSVICGASPIYERIARKVDKQ